MNRSLSRMLAVVEVLLVMLVTFGAAHGISRTPFTVWQLEHVHYLFHGQPLFALVPIAWLLLTRCSPPVYGASLRHWRTDGIIAPAIMRGLPQALVYPWIRSF